MNTSLATVVALLLPLGAAVAQSQNCNQPNILWMGNSLAYGMKSFVNNMAEHTGRPLPYLSDQIAGGQWLRDLAADPVLLASYVNSAPPGETWDYVIVQGYSTEPTVTRGDPWAFATNAGTIVQAAKTHSPNAQILLFETYAYAPGHSYYPRFYPDPAAMQADIRAGYQLAYDIIEATHGPGSVRLLPIGSGFEAAGFDPYLYQNDNLHAYWPGRILASLVIYREIYRENLGEISVTLGSYSGSTEFERRVASFGVSQSTYENYADLADQTGHPYLGSAFDLISARRVNQGPWSNRPIVEISPGETFEAWFQSPLGTYGSTWSVILLAPFDTGSPLPSLGIPELHVPAGPGTSVISLSPPAAGGSLWSLTIPSSFPTGVSFMVQYANFDPAPCRNNQFTTGDAIEGQIR